MPVDLSTSVKLEKSLHGLLEHFFLFIVFHLQSKNVTKGKDHREGEFTIMKRRPPL